MTQTDQSIKDFARRAIFKSVGSDDVHPATVVAAVECAFDPLPRRLAMIVGPEGCRAMLARSLVLSKREFPWLDAVHVSKEGVLVGLREVASERERTEVEAGCVALLAHFLSLLVNLIGEDVTGRLLHKAWPDLPFPISNLDAKEMDE